MSTPTDIPEDDPRLKDVRVLHWKARVLLEEIGLKCAGHIFLVSAQWDWSPRGGPFMAKAADGVAGVIASDEEWRGVKLLMRDGAIPEGRGLVPPPLGLPPNTDLK